MQLDQFAAVWVESWVPTFEKFVDSWSLTVVKEAAIAIDKILAINAYSIEVAPCSSEANALQ